MVRTKNLVVFPRDVERQPTRSISSMLFIACRVRMHQMRDTPWRLRLGTQGKHSSPTQPIIYRRPVFSGIPVVAGHRDCMQSSGWRDGPRKHRSAGRRRLHAPGNSARRRSHSSCCRWYRSAASVRSSGVNSRRKAKPWTQSATILCRSTSCVRQTRSPRSSQSKSRPLANFAMSRCGSKASFACQSLRTTRRRMSRNQQSQQFM